MRASQKMRNAIVEDAQIIIDRIENILPETPRDDVDIAYLHTLQDRMQEEMSWQSAMMIRGAVQDVAARHPHPNAFDASIRPHDV